MSAGHLQVPDKAWEALQHCIKFRFDVVRDDVRKIAAPMIVAELRRLLHGRHPGTLAEALRDDIARLEEWP